MKKILTIGGATKDIFFTYQQAQMLHLVLYEGRRSFLIFEDGKKVEIEALEYHSGGGATNTAVGLSRLGHTVSTFFKIGHDQEGAFIIKSLQDDHVNTEPVIVTDSAPTATSCIIPTESGNRVAMVYRGANLTINQQEIPENKIKESDMIYITSLCGESGKLLLPIVQLAKEQNKIIGVNPGTRQLTIGTETLCHSMPYIDILIVNAWEACCCMAAMVKRDRKLQIKMINTEPQKFEEYMPELLQGPIAHQGLCFSLRTFFQEVHALGPAIVIVTNGKEGVYASIGSRILFHEVLSVPVISTLGAGDAFGSGFFGWYAHDHPIEDCIRAGMLNSASVIGHVGAKVGLLTIGEMEIRLSKIIKSMLQEY